jgi:hypothetical protein
MKKLLLIIVLATSLNTLATNYQCPDSASVKNDSIEFYFLTPLSETPYKIEMETDDDEFTFKNVVESTFNSYTVYKAPLGKYSDDVDSSTIYEELEFEGKKGKELAECYTSGALPVTLIEFKGKEIGGSVLLEWSTATELNSSHFILQRYVNEGWIDISTIKTSGNSNEINQYFYYDYEPFTRNYYRLVHYDFDGSFQIHDVIYVYTKTIEISDPMLGYDLLGRKINDN